MFFFVPGKKNKEKKKIENNIEEFLVLQTKILSQNLNRERKIKITKRIKNKITFGNSSLMSVGLSIIFDVIFNFFLFAFFSIF